MAAPGVSGRAAPGGVEAASGGAGRVDLAAVDEGELAGGRAGGGGGGAVVLTVAPVPGQMVGQAVSGRAAPGPGEAARRGAGGEGDALVDEGEDTGGLHHGSSAVSVAGAGVACRRARSCYGAASCG